MKYDILYITKSKHCNKKIMHIKKSFQIKKKNNIFIFFLIFLNLTVCCQSANNILIKNNYFYENIKKKLKKEQFDDAIAILKKIKKNNWIHLNDDKIQINLIYAYYKTLNFNKAKKQIEEFLQFYPNHPNIDYVMYIQCLIQIAMDKNIFSTPFPLNVYKNDPYYAKNAFFQLKKFIYQYPNSLYIINAKKKLIDLKYRLSEHDLKILEFYFFNKEYVATINRGEEIIQKYSETPAARKSLIYMKKSYIALKIFKTAKKISQIISLNNI